MRFFVVSHCVVRYVCACRAEKCHMFWRCIDSDKRENDTHIYDSQSVVKNSTGEQSIDCIAFLLSPN